MKITHNNITYLLIVKNKLKNKIKGTLNKKIQIIHVYRHLFPTEEKITIAVPDDINNIDLFLNYLQETPLKDHYDSKTIYEQLKLYNVQSQYFNYQSYFLLLISFIKKEEDYQIYRNLPNYQEIYLSLPYLYCSFKKEFGDLFLHKWIKKNSHNLHYADHYYVINKGGNINEWSSITEFKIYKDNMKVLDINWYDTRNNSIVRKSYEIWVEDKKLYRYIQWYEDGSNKKIYNHLGDSKSKVGVLSKRMIKNNKEIHIISGLYVGWFNNIKEISNYDNGKLSGVFFSFYENLSIFANYEDGLSHGMRINLYGNGNFDYINNYKAGILEGVTLSFYSSGNLQSVNYYQNNLNVGISKGFYDNSPNSLKSITKHVDGLNIHWHENCILKSIYFMRNNNIHGIFKKWYDNGVLKESSIYVQGMKNGPYISRYENNKINVRTNYINNTLHGQYESQHENGKTALIINYSNGKLVSNVPLINSSISNIKIFARKDLFPRIPFNHKKLYIDDIIVEYDLIDIEYSSDDIILCKYFFNKHALVKKERYYNDGSLRSQYLHKENIYRKIELNMYKKVTIVIIFIQQNKQESEYQKINKYTNNIGSFMISDMIKLFDIQKNVKGYYKSYNKNYILTADIDYDGKLTGKEILWYNNNKIKSICSSAFRSASG